MNNINVKSKLDNMNNKKILITGAGGMLGSTLLNILKYKNIVGITSEFDIADSNLINNILINEKPDIIIHTAAYTDVDACEANIDRAYKINTIGTQNIVNYCINKDVLLVYISSTGIYNSSNKRNTEFDLVNPTSIHHKSKYEAEKIVQSHINKYLILRTGWLYGGKKTHAKNFVYKRYLEAIGNSCIFSDNKQIGNPTSIIDLGKQINVLIENNQYGIFNCVNEAKEISRFDYVKKIVEFFELNCDVKIAQEGIYKRIAPVSKNESAINYKLNLLGLNVMGKWEDALYKYIKLLKSEL